MITCEKCGAFECIDSNGIGGGRGCSCKPIYGASGGSSGRGGEGEKTIDLSKLKETKSATCEEANMYGMNNPKTGEPYPCGKAATYRMACERDGRIYAMCDMCAHHNTKRGMIKISINEVKP